MPWLSRAVLGMIRSQYEAEIHDLRKECEFLRGELSTAYRHHRAIERKEHRLPDRETIDPPKPVESLPAEITKLVSIHPGPAQEDLLASIRAARQQKPPLTWEEILFGLRSSMPQRLLESLEAK